MSYSFTVTATTKEDANKQIRDKLEEIAVQQPSHIADKEAVIVAAQSFVRLLEDPDENQLITVNAYGSLVWKQDGPDKFQSANVSITVNLRQK